MAEKIILELKDKDFVKNNNHYLVSPKKEEQRNNFDKSIENDIVSTLSTMWYQKQAILEALSKIDPELKNMQEIIPAVIKEL